VASITAYLTGVYVALDRRNRASWQELAGRLAPGSGRRTAFHNAGVLLEMMDYARRADKPIDAALAESLRREAMRARLAAFLAPAPRV